MTNIKEFNKKYQYVDISDLDEDLMCETDSLYTEEEECVKVLLSKDLHLGLFKDNVHSTLLPIQYSKQYSCLQSIQSNCLQSNHLTSILNNH